MATMTVATADSGNPPVTLRWTRVRVESDRASYTGRMLVGSRVSSVAALAKGSPFLTLTSVSINDQESLQPFVAVDWRSVRHVRLVNEDGVVQELKARRARRISPR